MLRFALIVSCSLLGGCWASHERTATRSDAGGVDAGGPDAGRPDAGRPDAGPPPPPREPRWVRLAEESPAPPPRLNHFAAYDAARDRLLVFGGFDPYGDLGRCCLTPYIEHRDVWALDRATERWEQVGELDRTLLAVMPSEVAVDSARDRLVLVAQTDFNGGASRVFAIDLESFAVTTPVSGNPWPGAASPLRVAWDRERGALVANDAYFDDVTEGAWRLDLASTRWVPFGAEGRPDTRFHNPLTASPSGSLFLYAGFGHTGEADAELWRLDPDAGTWTQLPVSPSQPGRWGFRAVFEPVRARLVVFGGYRLTVPHGTVMIDPTTGAAEALELDPAPVGRRDFTMVLDPSRREALVFGGAVASTRALADTWALELP